MFSQFFKRSLSSLFKSQADQTGSEQKQISFFHPWHGPLNIDRAELSCGSVAYICHSKKKPEDAIFNAERVHYISVDRNQGEPHDVDNVMSENSQYGQKSDFQYAAESACNQVASMKQAMIVVFFDHAERRETVGHDQVLRELREKFPASLPNRDHFLPEPKFKGPTRAQDTPKKEVTFSQLGLCG